MYQKLELPLMYRNSEQGRMCNKSERIGRQVSNLELLDHPLDQRVLFIGKQGKLNQSATAFKLKGMLWAAIMAQST